MTRAIEARLVKGISVGKDKVSGQHTCKSYFEKLCNYDSAGEFLDFKMIWKVRITPKIQVYLWALAQGQLNYEEVFQRKFPNFCLSFLVCDV